MNHSQTAVIHRSGGKYLSWLMGIITFVIVPTIGSVILIFQCIKNGISLVGLAIFLFFYTIQMLGVTVGAHRYFSHRSFKTSTLIKIVLAISASMSQGSLLFWIATHRRHHHLTDQEGDLHSPHEFVGNSIMTEIKNFVHAHIGWMLTPDIASYEKYAKDWLDDDILVRIDNLSRLWLTLAFILPMVMGFIAIVTTDGAIIGFLWGCLSLFCVQNSTFCINSVCHLYGKRAYNTNDQSVNNLIVAILAFGEGWHNNHHAFPFSAKLGINKHQIDFGYYFINILSRFGLVWDVKIGSDLDTRNRNL